MQMLKSRILILLAPLMMAAVAAAQMESVVPEKSDEADAQVERVIKAAMDMRIDQAPVDDWSEERGALLDHGLDPA